MTLRTGKTGRYRYYACSTCARQGKSACKGRSIPMDKLDRLVTDRLADRLLTPERVGDLLAALLQRQSAKDEDHVVRLTAIKTKLTDAESRLARLYAAIESGVADLTDTTLKDRVATVKTERDIAQTSYDRALAETSPRARITPDKIAASVEIMRNNILAGDTPFRRAYIRSVIDQVEVDDAEIRIVGVLERLVMGGGAAPAGVPSFGPKWLPEQDSNLRPSINRRIDRDAKGYGFAQHGWKQAMRNPRPNLDNFRERRCPLTFPDPRRHRVRAPCRAPVLPVLSASNVRS
jgi:site-specific DNA recombinase